MSKNYFRPPVGLTLKETIGFRKLQFVEKSLFSPVPLLRWHHHGLTLLQGLSRGGENVVYRANYKGQEVIVKTPSANGLKNTIKYEPETVDLEFSLGKKLAGIDGIPEYFDKKLLNIDLGRGIVVQSSLMLMEYIDGQPLHAVTGSGQKLVEQDKVFILKSLLKTLSAIHAKGIVHKDINPANILVHYPEDQNDELKVWLIDFGASMHSRRYCQLYGAPEQQMPLAFGDVGRQSDIFSLGLVMYELFENRLPFTTETAVKSIVDRDRLVLKFQRGTSEVIKTVLTRMVEKDLSKRFQNIETILQVIR